MGHVVDSQGKDNELKHTEDDAKIHYCFINYRVRVVGCRKDHVRNHFLHLDVIEEIRDFAAIVRDDYEE